MFGFLKFIVRNFVWIALIIIALAAGVWVTGKVQDFRDLFFPETVAYVRSPLTIVNSIQGMGQLVTVTSEVAKTDLKIEIKRGPLNLGGYSANHIAVGAIEAGINFDEIDEDSIRREGDTYTLTLPASVITSCRIEHIDQNRHSFTLLSADWDMVRQMAQAEALARFAGSG